MKQIELNSLLIHVHLLKFVREKIDVTTFTIKMKGFEKSQLLTTSVLWHVLFLTLTASKKDLSFTCYGFTGIWPGQET